MGKEFSSEIIVFTLGGDLSYAVEVSDVREVVRLGPVTEVPATPEVVVGAMNADGHVVAVVDLGLLLGGRAVAPSRGDAGLWISVEDSEAVLCPRRVLEVCRVRGEVEKSEGLRRSLHCERGELQLLDVGESLAEVERRVASVVHDLRYAYPPERQAPNATEQPTEGKPR